MITVTLDTFYREVIKDQSKPICTFFTNGSYVSRVVEDRLSRLEARYKSSIKFVKILSTETKLLDIVKVYEFPYIIVLPCNYFLVWYNKGNMTPSVIEGMLLKSIGKEPVLGVKEWERLNLD